MGWFDTDDFLTGLAAGVQKSLDEADRKRQEAEQKRQAFIQALQLRLLEQIPEIEKNVFAGKSDPASAAASLQQLSQQGMALAPQVPAGSFVNTLANAIIAPPTTAETPTLDLSQLEGRFSKAQEAGSAVRKKESETKLEFEKQKAANQSSLIEGRAGRLEEQRQENRKELKSIEKKQEEKDTALMKNVDFLTGQYQKLLGLDEKQARLKAVRTVAESPSAQGVGTDTLFRAKFPFGMPNDPTERAAEMADFNSLVNTIGRNQPVVAAEPQPLDPKIAQRIVELRKQGMPADKIKAFLTQKGLDPSAYGL